MFHCVKKKDDGGAHVGLLNLCKRLILTKRLSCLVSCVSVCVCLCVCVCLWLFVFVAVCVFGCLRKCLCVFVPVSGAFKSVCVCFSMCVSSPGLLSPPAV